MAEADAASDAAPDPMPDPTPGRVAVSVTAARYALGRLRLVGPALNARYHLRHAERLGGRVTLRGRPHVVNDGTMIFGDAAGWSRRWRSWNW
jgi:hypothetical protein